jgi:hypothetical protein
MDGIKVLIVLVLFGIVAGLGKALFHNSSGGSDHAGHWIMSSLSTNIPVQEAIALYLRKGGYDRQLGTLRRERSRFRRNRPCKPYALIYRRDTQ